MARRTAYLHIGLPGSGGGFLGSALAEHEDALTHVGLRHPAVSAEEMFRAAIEIRRDHKAWGYGRREVEGTWAEICRRAHKGKADIVLSQELLAGCTADQIALLLDTLDGFDVRAIITAREADREDPELGQVSARWSSVIGRDNRVHLFLVPADAEARTWIWQQIGDLTGFDATALSVAGSGLPPYLVRSLAHASGLDSAQLPGEVVDAEAGSEEQLWWTTDVLSATLVEVARLREHNKALEERNAKLEKKRSKLKKKLAQVS